MSHISGFNKKLLFISLIFEVPLMILSIVVKPVLIERLYLLGIPFPESLIPSKVFPFLSSNFASICL